MKIKTEISIEDFAVYLAESDDKEQAEFFNVFFKALRMSCETAYHFNQQKTAIAFLLNERAKESCNLMGFDDEN